MTTLENALWFTAGSVFGLVCAFVFLRFVINWDVVCARLVIQ